MTCGFDQNQGDHHHESARDCRIQTVIEDKARARLVEGPAASNRYLRQKADARIGDRISCATKR